MKKETTKSEEEDQSNDPEDSQTVGRLPFELEDAGYDYSYPK